MGISAFAAIRSNPAGANSNGEVSQREISQASPGTAVIPASSRDTVSDVEENNDIDEPKIPDQRLSTWSPSHKGAVEVCDESRMRIVLKPQLKVSIIGHCDLAVITGTVVVYGATLLPQDGFVSLVAPSAHALPSIKCISKIPAVIELWHIQHDLQRLGRILLHYQHIWNQHGTSAAFDIHSLPIKRSFSVVFNTAEDKRPLRPLYYPPSWRSCVDQIINIFKTKNDTPRILICGPKSSGKSTFARFCTNNMLSARAADYSFIKANSGDTIAKDSPASSVFWLDLDPGQPEFSPPGQISLVHVKRPILGPPFSHASNQEPSPYEITRAHCLGTADASVDHTFFWEGITDLWATYVQGDDDLRKSPLIINCPGYDPQSRYGSRLVKELHSLAQVTHTIFLGDSGDTLRSQFSNESAAGRLSFLPEAPVHFRQLGLSAAQLRAMQTASYFHSVGNNRWSSTELSKRPAWKLRYDCSKPDILGITTILEHPAQPSLLKTIIHKWVLGISVIDGEDREIAQANSTVCRTSDGNLPYLCQTGDREPYRVPVGSSRLIGWGYVSNINTEKETIDLITPVPQDIQRRVMEKSAADQPRILLIRGATDAPEWAYIEEVLAKPMNARLPKDTNDDDAVELDISRLNPDYYKPQGLSATLNNLDYIETSRNKVGLEGRIWKPTPRISEPLPKRTRTE